MTVVKIVLPSDEQLKYIMSTEIGDTKLLACPGSGKTFCVLRRMINIANRSNKQHVFMITFSRSAANDAKTKMKRDHPNSKMIQQISTFHSFAGKILSKVNAHKLSTNDNKGLSLTMIRLHEFLESLSDDTDISHYGPLSKVKDLFVDEAQDLDPLQFKCLQLLRQKLGVRIHLIGDPNQCIYQFRYSASTFLLSFDAKTFYLTKNFRSTPEIVKFINQLVIHPFEHPSTPSKPASGVQPRLHYLTKEDALQYIHSRLSEENVVYSDYAVLVPSKKGSDHAGIGGSVIFDFLCNNQIPVQRFYSLDSDENKAPKPVKEEKKNCVSLHTYHSSKGLEYKHVIVMDCHHEFFNRKPTEADYDEKRYLVYVALSRAATTLDIIVRRIVNNPSPGIFRSLIDVPRNLYQNLHNHSLHAKDFAPKDTRSPVFGVTEIIKKVSQETLAKLTQIFTYRLISSTNIDTHVDYKMNDYHTFRGIFVDECIRHLYYLYTSENAYIPSIATKRGIPIVNLSEAHYKQMIEAQNRLGTWAALHTTARKTDINRTLREGIKDLVRFADSSIELYQNCFCYHDEIRSELFLNSIKPLVERARIELQTCTFDNPKLPELAHLLIYWRLESEIGHFGEYGNIVEEVLSELTDDHVQQLKNFVKEHLVKEDMQPEFQVNVHETLSNLFGSIDMILNDEICEFKCTQEAYSFEHILQLWLYGIARNRQIQGQQYTIYNFCKGMKYIIFIECHDPFEALTLFSETGELQMTGLKLMYDLETNGLIDGEYVPYPIQICCKEYSTGMTVIPETLIRLPKNVVYNEESYRTHKITSKQLQEDGQDLVAVQNYIVNRLRCVENAIYFAHNGNMFDNRISRQFNLLPESTGTVFDDTIKVIKHFVVEKLPHYSLDFLCQHFGVKSEDVIDSSKRHTAGADVDLLIHLMRDVLNIKLMNPV